MVEVRMGKSLGQWLFLAVVLSSAACGELTQATIGVAPWTDQVPTTAWSPVPGAAAYQVVLSLDRAGMAPVGTTGLLMEPQLDPAKIAWHEGHPIQDRTYFWVARAFDRTDPRGIMLSVTEPREIRFTAQPSGVAITYQELTPTPTATAASTATASAEPAATP
jgi:hypothetical protein